MAARQLFGRNAAPVAVGLLSATALVFPRTALAESPEAESIVTIRKPIYDDPNSPKPQPDSQSSSSKNSTTDQERQNHPQQPTPTDRLAVHVRRVRLALYESSSTAESHVNDYLTRALKLENSFADTIASLAPPPTANEPLVPGMAYVLVSALAGSILTRNRGIILRFSVPLAFGVAAAEAAMPVTMRNVGDLVWSWEQKYPELAKAHISIRERAEQLWETGKSHTAMTRDIIVDKADDARKGVEDWVKKGK